MTNRNTTKTVLIQAKLTLSFLLFNLSLYIHSYIRIINELLLTISHTLNVYQDFNTNI